jgi:uncharacterized membrane protein YqiK
MKNIFTLLAVLLISTQLTGCFNLSTADANEEIVLIPQPYIFGTGGVIDDPVSNGASWVAWSTKEVSYIISPISYEISFNDVISSDNVPVDLSATAIIKIKSGESPALHKGFGQKWYVEKVQRQFLMLTRNFVRDNKHKDLMNSKKTIQEGQIRISNELTEYLNKEGMQVILQAIILGKANPPEKILAQISETAAQTERSETEARRYDAEVSRKQAETAKADADKSYQTKMGFSPQEYLGLRSLEVEEKRIEMAKDKKNVTVIMNGGGGAVGTFKVKQT